MNEQKDLTGAVLRAARELRNKTENLTLAEPEAREAWEKLDEAIRRRDDFIAGTLEDTLEKKGRRG